MVESYWQRNFLPPSFGGVVSSFREIMVFIVDFGHCVPPGTIGLRMIGDQYSLAAEP
jgi:hypothetical protein